MCGIVGYIGDKDASGILLDGLKRLEYRGYDSAGIALINGRGKVDIRRSTGKLSNLENLLKESPLSGKIGIGHTRWATHGKPTENNAHPHKAGDIVIVHNGIIENHIQLRDELIKKGHNMKSETDTEIVSHLIQQNMFDGLEFIDAFCEALKRVEGSYALVALNEKKPDQLIAARMGSPLVCGLGKGEHFFASDIPALINYTREVLFLEDGEVVLATKGGMEVLSNGEKVERQTKIIDWTPTMAEKGFYKHFMLKEIHEQSRAAIDTMQGRISTSLEEIGIEHKKLGEFKKAVIIACGTSYHAALVGKYYFEEIARLPTECDLASEFRYRDPIISDDTLLVLISQSGETADTLAAMKEGKDKGATALTICNVMDSSMARLSDGVLYTHAGPEVGVAATKTFTAQLIALYMLSLYIAEARGELDEKGMREYFDELVKLPHHITNVLAMENRFSEIAQKYQAAKGFLFLGRGLNYPIALEGALKLKEISYIHAEGYAAGEMKHGPIALIDENMPVVVLVTRDSTYEKIFSNLEEARARGGKIIALASPGDEDIVERADDVIWIPSTSHYLTPVLCAIPLQLLAYHIAVLKGTDIDQPRNLAKSVTVE